MVYWPTIGPLASVTCFNFTTLPGLALKPVSALPVPAAVAVGDDTPLPTAVAAVTAVLGLSVAQDSTLVAAFLRSLLSEASTPFLRWLRKTGMAMAARMPM